MQEKIKTLVSDVVAGKQRFYSHPSPSGRGIVLCAGGRNLFASAIVTLRLLRDSGCRLPIEWFYADAGEMHEDAIRFIEENFDAQCINFDDVPGFKQVSKRGFQIKALAIAASRFDEVLFVDSDNLAVSDPSYLFDTEEYRKNGAIFWIDVLRFGYESDFHRQKHSTCCELLGLAPPDYGEHEFETGQILIHKLRHDSALQLTLFMNLNYPIFYKLLYGDKDTFRYAWKRCQEDMHIMAKPAIIGHYGFNNKVFRGFGFVQYGLKNEPLWIHMNMRAWYEKQESWNFWVQEYKHAKIFRTVRTRAYYNFTDESVRVSSLPEQLKSIMQTGERYWSEIFMKHDALLDGFE